MIIVKNRIFLTNNPAKCRAMCYSTLGKRCSMEMGRTSLRIPESTASMERTSLLTLHGEYRKSIYILNIKENILILLHKRKKNIYIYNHPQIYKL